MKKLFFLFISLTLAAVSYAQVGINTTTPHASTVLDVESTTKGVLLPRMTTSQKTAIASPAPGLLVYDTNTQCISQNIAPAGSPVGTWICLSQKDNQSSFFYMPATSIVASAVVSGKTLDLYDTYKSQFTNPAFKSTSAPASIPYFPSAGQLNYYVTHSDTTVVKITNLSDTGVLTYNILTASPCNSFINVVFVVK